LSLDLGGTPQTFSGSISGLGGLLLRGSYSGSITLTGINTYAGITGIAHGQYITDNASVGLNLAGGDNRLPTTTILKFGYPGATGLVGKLTLGSGSGPVNQTLAGLTSETGTGSYAIVGGYSAYSQLNVNNVADFTFSGKLGGSGFNENMLSFAKTGSGVLTWLYECNQWNSAIGWHRSWESRSSASIQWGYHYYRFYSQFDWE
jgi:hypothetical protein